MTKLNLGGGSLRFDGFVNIDLSDTADLKHDLRTPLPYKDESVDEIIAVHVIESFYQWEFPGILEDWYRVLKWKGKITIEFSVLDKAIGLYLNGSTEKLRTDGHWGLYGNQTVPCDPIVLHHYVYEEVELGELLLATQFRNISFSDKGVIHHRLRDLRVIAYK